MKKTLIGLAVIAYGMIGISVMIELFLWLSKETAGLYRETTYFVFAIVSGIILLYFVWRLFLYLLFKVVYVISSAIAMGKNKERIGSDVDENNI